MIPIHYVRDFADKLLVYQTKKKRLKYAKDSDDDRWIRECNDEDRKALEQLEETLRLCIKEVINDTN